MNDYTDFEKRIYKDGYKAYRTGHKFTECPYCELSTHGMTAWGQGWMDAQRNKEAIRSIRFPEHTQ